jgi:DNA-binding MarR family transcriptional regulator
MASARTRKNELIDEIVENLSRRHGTAAMLFHHALGERLGLGPADHKCLDLLRERGPMTGSELSAIIGLTTGGVTGITARLEKGGFVRRESDPKDGRKQFLRPNSERLHELHEVFGPLHEEVAALLATYDVEQLAAIASFLERTTDIVYRHTALLRGGHLSGAPHSAEDSARGHVPPAHHHRPRGARRSKKEK